MVPLGYVFLDAKQAHAGGTDLIFPAEHVCAADLACLIVFLTFVTSAITCLHRDRRDGAMPAGASLALAMPASRAIIPCTALVNWDFNAKTAPC